MTKARKPRSTPEQIAANAKARNLRWRAKREQAIVAAAEAALARDPMDVAALAALGRIPRHAATALIGIHGITSLSHLAGNTVEQIAAMHKVGRKGAEAISAVRRDHPAAR
jgi:hypothetical protein